jgi:NADH-quinone oxidoreductase subunit E
MSVFSAELKTVIEKELKRYETKRSAILPILHAIQDAHRYVSEEHIDGLEKEFDLSKIHVREVLTFYSLYHTEKPADFEILFCDNIVCHMMGANKTISKIKERIEAVEKTGKKCSFSVEGVPCLGVCDGAPAMLVNKDRYLKVTAQNVDEILNKYSR